MTSDSSDSSLDRWAFGPRRKSDRTLAAFVTRVALGAFSVGGTVSLAGMAGLGCATSTQREGFEPPTQAGTVDPTAPSTGEFDTKTPPPPVEPLPEINEVFGHSATTLFRLDPITKAVTTVGTFDGCQSVIDIALDEGSRLFAVSEQSLYTVDKATARCTHIATGSYPNSLSFVPKGTIDSAAEALVGYEGKEYVRINPTTGEKSKVGELRGGLESSGDIVSVKGGKSYLTVKGKSSCNKTDCLIEIDPKTGDLVKNWGSIEHDRVFGLSFWGGKIYGFGADGELFEVTFGTTQLATVPITIPDKPADLSFWGAGSSTSAPLVSGPQ